MRKQPEITQQSGIAQYCGAMWNTIAKQTEFQSHAQIGETVAEQYHSLPPALQELFEAAARPMPAEIILGPP